MTLREVRAGFVAVLAAALLAACAPAAPPLTPTAAPKATVAAPAVATPAAAPSSTATQGAARAPVIQPWSLVYLLLPIEQALLNESEKKYVSDVSSVYADTDLFAEVERQFRDLRAKTEGRKDEINAIDLVLRQIQQFRSVYKGKSVMILVPERKLFFPAAGWSQEVSVALRSYGYVFIELNGDSFHPARPPEIRRTQWEQSKGNRIQSGKWAGAVQISEKEVLLPGLKSFEQ